MSLSLHLHFFGSFTWGASILRWWQWGWLGLTDLSGAHNRFVNFWFERAIWRARERHAIIIKTSHLIPISHWRNQMVARYVNIKTPQRESLDQFGNLKKTSVFNQFWALSSSPHVTQTPSLWMGRDHHHACLCVGIDWVRFCHWRADWLPFWARPQGWSCSCETTDWRHDMMRESMASSSWWPSYGSSAHLWAGVVLLRYWIQWK